ncbi:MAG: dihydrodipicolinate synthase family protein [Inquilinaceae bacterium]
MYRDTITPDLLARSVLAVPPLARTADLGVDRDQNARIVTWLRQGGVTTYMYGGNANLYHAGVSDFTALLDMLESIAPDDGWMIPSVGPDFGKARDQLVLMRGRDFPTAMVLPTAFPKNPAGVADGLGRLADAYGRPVIAYVKDDSYVAVRDLARLLSSGAVCAVKYAVVRDDPAQDPYLARILDAVGTSERIISGIGERPVVEHLADIGLMGFTSGSVCIAPHLSMQILHALKRGDRATAVRVRGAFLALETVRDQLSPIAVLHEAVRLAGIAETGPIGPMLSNIADAADLDRIRSAAVALHAKSVNAGNGGEVAAE